jgi:hypothetical protein
MRRPVLPKSAVRGVAVLRPVPPRLVSVVVGAIGEHGPLVPLATEPLIGRTELGRLRRAGAHGAIITWAHLRRRPRDLRVPAVERGTGRHPKVDGPFDELKSWAP